MLPLSTILMAAICVSAAEEVTEMTETEAIQCMDTIYKVQVEGSPIQIGMVAKLSETYNTEQLRNALKAHEREHNR